MTLIEAFRRVAPLIGVPQADRERSEAARVVHSSLRSLAASTPLLRSSSPQDRDEAVATVLLRLVQSGPRAVRVGDPENDVSVIRYLRAGLHNAARDRLRATSRRLELPLDDAEPAPESSGSAEDLVDLSRAARELEAAFDDLVSQLLPIAMAGKRSQAGERLKESVQQLIELFEGHTSVERLVALVAPDGSPEATRKARYTLYQRHHRAIVSLFDALKTLEQRTAVPPSRLQSLRAVLNGLRIGTEPRGITEDS